MLLYIDVFLVRETVIVRPFNVIRIVIAFILYLLYLIRLGLVDQVRLEERREDGECEKCVEGE